MAINNELSSEIAAAIMSHLQPAEDRERLKEIILKVHSALQTMRHDTNERSRAAASAAQRDPSVNGTPYPTSGK